MTTKSTPTLVVPEIPETRVTAPDPFTLDNLLLDQSFEQTVGVRKVLKTVPAKKPNPQDFVRVHPGLDYRGKFQVIELQEDRELYLVGRGMAAQLVAESAPVMLYTAINRQGVVRIWPIRLPGLDGKTNEWWRSSMEGAEMAMTQWVRLKANMSLGAYEIFVAESTISEPEWPTLPFMELLRISFKDRLIETEDHPVIKRLRGAA
jgi:hypothetical protein